ncbi:MAG: acyltransferase family protein [Cyanophyceae cyanobacterium]
MQNAPSARLTFMDNLRVALTILVVAHHAAQPYGPTGGEWPIFNPERAMLLGSFFAVNAAFFMGLFFFIAGYFTPVACDRKGVRQFLQERLQRLGIPLLFFTLFVFPPVLYSLAAPPVSFFAFFIQVYIHQWDIEVAHLWFLMHLLVYTVCYVLWQHRFDLPTHTQIPSHQTILVYLLSLTVVTFIVRIQYPIDQWVNLFGILPTEVAHLPQYVSLFMLGIVAYRRRWLEGMARWRGYIWLGIGLSAALLRYGYSLNQERLALPMIFAGGGLNWRNLVWSGWEATICVGLCIGLLILFREKLNSQGRLLRMLSANAYGVYLIHLLLVLYLQFQFADLSLGPLTKFLLVFTTGTPLCFALSALLRQLPLTKLVVP